MRPDVLCDLIALACLNPVDRKGMVFDPIRWS